jgi:Uma2 family endonuclease
MATATQPVHMSLDLYLKSSFEPDAEYVDGVIEVRPVGEYDHSSWQHAIEIWFAQHAKEWGIRVRPELRVQVARARFRVPDVTILDRNLPVEQIVTRAPIAVFEVLSPEDSINRMMAKLADYQHFRYVAGRLEPLSSEPFDLPDSSCRFDLAEIEKLLD